MSDVLDEKLNISTPAQDVLPVPVRRLRGARARRPFMSVVWTSWKLPIFIKFHQKFHTPEDLTRGPRSNLDPTSDLDPTSHLDPTWTPPLPYLSSTSTSKTSP